MQDRGNGLRRIPLLRRWVNKDHQARLRLLVNDEHKLVNPVRCGLDPGLGVLMLRSVLCEVLIGGGKLAGRERLTSAGCDHDAHLRKLRRISLPRTPVNSVGFLKSLLRERGDDGGEL